MKLSDIKQLYQSGFALIWLHPKSKRPLENKWTSGARKPWAEFENSIEKDYNVGVRLGEPSKLKTGKFLAVIDCDVKSRKTVHQKEMQAALELLARKHGIDLDTSPTVTSGRGNGSKHVYTSTSAPTVPHRYAQSKETVRVLMPSVPPNATEKQELSLDDLKQGLRIRHAWEISIMGNGQQVVLPPSIHPDSGLPYKWENKFELDRLDIAAEFKFEKEERDYAKSAIEDFEAVDVDLFDGRLQTKTVNLIISGDGGDRSASLFSACMSMCRAQFTDNEILSVLTDKDNYLGLAAYDHTESGSRKRAAAWVAKYTLEKARRETSAAKLFESLVNIEEIVPDEDTLMERELDGEDLDFDNRRMPDLDGNGKPKPTLKNVKFVVEEHIGKKTVAFDEFSNRSSFCIDTPYGGHQGRELTDSDDLMLKSYTSDHFRFEPSKELCFEAHQVLAKKNRFHPIREWLDTLVWDGVPRLGTWLEYSLGAMGDERYLSAVGTKTLVGAVARIYEPGCKFDYVLVLEGLQGKKKSTALQVLAGAKFFTDHIGDITQKDVVDNMCGKWIIELGELASVKKADVDTLKGFLSRQVDRIRMPYGKRSEDYPRQSIFIGSTNLDEYLHDETGNRRFWPVKVEQADVEWIKENRTQLWAEAVEAYQLGETLFLEPEIEALAGIEQDLRFATDDLEEPVKAFVKKKKLALECFTTTDVYAEVMQDPFGRPSNAESHRLGKILRRLKMRRGTIRVGEKVLKGWQP